MITFDRCFDIPLITRILTDKRCYCRMANDAAPAATEFRVVDSDQFVPILAREDGEPAAVFFLIPQIAEREAEVHFCFVPAKWGHTLEIAQGFIWWVWRNTEFDRLTGPIPSYNRLARELAKSAGFREYDLLANAGTKNGFVYHLILTEAKRPT